MRYLFFLLLLVNTCLAQTPKPVNAVQRPKLVVGVVIDQMRWDFLYRYYDRYKTNGGFKKLIDKGFSCENTYINYIPTYTACGHTCLYTGSVPAIHGITGNNWYDTVTNKYMYCTEDKTVNGVGNNNDAGQMSPRNMLVTNICDELKIATNFRSKVIGISVKDRGAILPAGHAANAAYWFDGGTGNFISSTYYMKELPKWVTDFNNRKLPDEYLKAGWNTLYPVDTYAQSMTIDDFNDGAAPDKLNKFPHQYDNLDKKNYGALPGTPYGNTIVKEMAMAAVNNENIGRDSIADFLTVSFSTPDYVGHAYGPNSIEVEDIYLRLDKELAELFDFLDKKVGKDQYLVFLSADHGAAHSIHFNTLNKLPGQPIGVNFEKATDSVLKAKFGNYQFVKLWSNNQVFLNYKVIDSVKADAKLITKAVVDFLAAQTAVQRVFAYGDLMNIPLQHTIRERAINGYFPSHTGDIQVILKAGYTGMSGNGTTHGSWNPYDSHIPLLWYGWKIKQGKTNRETYMTDVAATLAALLKIQMPSGCVGTVIEEVTK